MKHLSVTFAIVLLLGGLMSFHQTRRLTVLENRQGALAAATDTVNPPRHEVSQADLHVGPAGVRNPPALAAAQDPEADPAAAFIEALKDKLKTSLKPEQVAGFLINEQAFESLALAAHLTAEERVSVQAGLKSYDLERAGLYLDRTLTTAARLEGLAEVKQRQEAWLAGQLGKDRYEAVLLSGKRNKRASAERMASAGVSRISSSVDLTEAQKAELHAGFLERSLNPAIPRGGEIAVIASSSIEMGPFAPDLSEDAEKILTPGQWQLYQGQMDASAKSMNRQGELMLGLMESLKPAFGELLESKP